ncbi:hypothetical protein HNP84_007346 [Thermocatellispora tengchongensis]|uniref:Uncharacterized protein n=1 Tax=Thermocatellispora tengchongensis TaxID=1073253 RepID=A0A840P8A4_9ACTN|nr:hypothetical protein [Thermocatellispora tengchongensis]MBB5137594.1 hypothetical protein [Thermocatellispora tengchongensis]
MIPTRSDLEWCPYGCRRLVLVTITDHGRRLAVEPTPDPAGNQAIHRTGTGTWRSRALNAADAMPVQTYEHVFMPHVAASPACRPAPPPQRPLPGLVLAGGRPRPRRYRRR